MTALFEVIETVMKDLEKKAAAQEQKIKKPVSEVPTKATN